MNIAPIKVEAFRINDLHALDPITITTEDVDLSEGKLTVECCGRSWSAYWGGMGDRTVRQFVAQANADYVAGKLASDGCKDSQLAYLTRIAQAVIDACKELEAGK